MGRADDKHRLAALGDDAFQRRGERLTGAGLSLHAQRVHIRAARQQCRDLLALLTEGFFYLCGRAARVLLLHADTAEVAEGRQPLLILPLRLAQIGLAEIADVDERDAGHFRGLRVRFLRTE